MNYKDLLENMIANLNSEISIIKTIINTIEDQLEQIENISFELQNK